ncbi:PaaI family thioesterase [Desulfonema magnum]|uniref:Phenylacetic acid degradation thioesterase n=1 Tax=Desulfonema magnum TaxID=45655 RepID=A0A975BRM9_9BACT|nr:PaaI family thioesterase [Desulfonema magnum]QTA89815.1 Phenylacetic acid degradation thioesterase [Desulfonema magnum]
MKTPNPEHIKKLSSLINISPYPSLLSMKLTDIGTGYARIELDIEKKHTQLRGVVHGGVFATLIDTVAFWAAYYEIEDPDAWMASVDLKLNYLAPAVSGKLIATGQRIKMGRKLCYADAKVTNAEGKLLAHGSSTLMVLHETKMSGKSLQLPPKFIESK